jgi:trk system potassium uptake protein TrkH
MNFPMIRYVTSWILRIEGLLLCSSLIIALIYGEYSVMPAYFIVIAGCEGVGFLLSKKPADTRIYQKSGYVAVALAWIVMSAVGALPFVITGEIPHYVDAVFEIVSGFTTTGSSILKDVEAVSHASLFWRSFSHWIGGMGVLVFILMFIPVKGGSQMNLMRAESPGPNVSKFVPRVHNTASILYKIYIGMTLGMIACLLIARMPWFDTLCITFGSAGTGGFGVLNSSCASYTAVQQWIITVGMAAFGVNFSFYFLLLYKHPKEAFKMEEVRAYVLIILASVAMITVQIMVQRPHYTHFEHALRAAAFQVSSIITTTGYSTTNFDLWPSFSKWILVLLMICGACAGSTGGGMKVSRVLVLLKTLKKELLQLVHPRSVRKVMLDGETVEHTVLRSINVFTAVYFLIFGLSVLLISLDGFSMETNFTAVAATLNNIGPGLAGVGPASNFSAYSGFSKVVLIFDMLAGRLEIFPMLLLFVPSVWRRS